jgi:hypothetical protein
MRYVPSIPPATTSPNTRQVRRLSAAQSVRPVSPREQPDLPYVDRQHHHQETEQPVERPHQREAPAEDRRKTCRRVSQQPVLVELRSGTERRRHNLREGDIVEHIDEIA